MLQTMDFILAIVFGALGTLAGLVVSGLGLAALKHVVGTTESDRVVGWTLWWWLDSSRYDANGQRLCGRGAWIFAIGLICWLLAVYFWRRSI